MKSDVTELLAEYSRLSEYSEMTLDSIETKSPFGDQPINIAATRGLASEVTTLLSAGADISNRGEHGYAPLHDAVEQGHLELVRLLIEKGADPHQKTDDMISPIELSIMLKEHDITRFLETI